jgi:hypothetical protein
LSHDIATVIASKTVNPETGTPYPVASIERAMGDAHISVKTTQSAKQQSVDVIRRLQKVLPIERVRLQVRVDAPLDIIDTIEAELLTRIADAEHCSSVRAAAMSSVTLLIEPAAYRIVEATVDELGARKAAVTVLAHVARKATGASSEEPSAASASSADALSGAGSFTSASLGPEAAAAEAASMGLGATYVAGEKAFAAASTPGSSTAAAKPAASSSPSPPAAAAAASGAFTCRKCAGAWFSTREAYREHFRSDWHRVNLKRGMRKQVLWSEAQWLALTDEEKATALVSEDAKS